MLAAIKSAASAPALAGVFVKSVRVAATYDHGHPVILTITWSWPEFASITRPGHCDGVTETTSARPADTAIMLSRSAPTVHEVEAEILALAWGLGAWDVRRIEHAPLVDPAQWREMRYGLSVDFGRNDYVIGGAPLMLGASAQDITIRHAAESGWVTWTLVPLAMATQTMRARWADKDKTLAADCSRSSPMPSIRLADWHHPEPGFGHEHIYQLGRANHGNRSKSSAIRRA